MSLALNNWALLSENTDRWLLGDMFKMLENTVDADETALHASVSRLLLNCSRVHCFDLTA